MGVEKRFFRALEENRKKQVIFFCVSIVALCALYLVSMNVIRRSYEILVDDYSWTYQIDSVEENEEKLEIKGWAFELNQDAKGDTFEIVLRNTTNGKLIYSSMIYEEREDVNEYFKCEFNYLNSGFVASVTTKKLGDAVYEIILKPKNVRKAYGTNIFLYKGNMTVVHPDDFVPLEVVGTDLEIVVNDGNLRVFRPEIGMYVYQHDNALYWITDEKYNLTGLGSWIQFHLNTTQIDRLPNERLENGWYWSNLGFYFQDNELVNWNTGNYRVSKYDLPTEYSIYQIFTGRHDEDWLWRNDFRPIYTFQ